ncbi:hypothetical protein [Actinacidiphila glaucinigra]|uniref:hypothetical protein n=1 Tax=Actinacidiphila glaucinigra TaxID=235986 RepID=UPI003672B2BD
MGYVRGFLPWIAFAVVATEADWRFGALAGLVLSAGLVVRERRAGHPVDRFVIEIGSGVFFALLAALAFAAPDSPLEPYDTALSLGWLALTAWGSLAVRRPFTLGIARTTAPPAVWDNPLFLRTNVIITAVWAASFTAGAGLLAVLLAAAPHALAAIVAVKLCGFTVPVVFTARYSRAVTARAKAAALPAAVAGVTATAPSR